MLDLSAIMKPFTLFCYTLTIAFKIPAPKRPFRILLLALPPASVCHGMVVLILRPPP